MQPPGVLLVEDDPAQRRFVELGLEDLPLRLHQAANVPEAWALLQQVPVRLVLTDLMLPGESGESLLQRLRSHPAVAPGALVAVCSAGLNQAVRARLAPLAPWRLLDKPVPLAVLRQCALDALQDKAPAAAAPSGMAPRHEPPAEAARQRDTETSEAALQGYFGGNRLLYGNYLQMCLAQFPHDRQAGARGAAEQDLVALRRLGHSLKSVLQTLGFEAAAAHARALERSAANTDAAAAVLHWSALDHALQDLEMCNISRTTPQNQS